MRCLGFTDGVHTSRVSREAHAWNLWEPAGASRAGHPAYCDCERRGSAFGVVGIECHRVRTVGCLVRPSGRLNLSESDDVAAVAAVKAAWAVQDG